MLEKELQDSERKNKIILRYQLGTTVYEEFFKKLL